VAALRAYVAGGGRLLLLAESHWLDRRQLTATSFPAGPLQGALEAWGLRLGPGLVAAPSGQAWSVEAEGRQVVGPYPWYLTVGAAENPDGPLALGASPALVPFAGEVAPLLAPGDGRRWDELLRSAPGWAIEDPADLHPLHDLPAAGPPRPRVLAGAVSAARADGQPGGRVVLLGDADLCRDGNQLAGNAGVALVLALADWALERTHGQVRGRAAPPPLDAGAARWQGWVFGLFYLWLPGGVLAGGLGLVRLRQRRAERRAAAVREARAAEVTARGGAA
jgi:hypothetical protein